jgi:tripartite-type tricarboxylate transporter receptor subunit TctC
MKTLRLLLAVVLSATVNLALAQAWPAKAVKFVMPSPPASSPDRYTRYLAERLSQKACPSWWRTSPARPR